MTHKEIKIKKFTPSSHLIKCLVYGNPKAGKTTFAGTAPNPLFICSENGLLSIANKKPDYVEITSLDDLKDVYSYLVNEKPKYDTIVIDSLSEISKVIKDKLTNNGDTSMHLKLWGLFADEMINIVRKLIQLPYHILVITHAIESDQDDGGKFYDFAIEGKSKNEIARYFDIIGFSYINKEGEYKINIKGNNRSKCGCRSAAIPQEDTPGDFGSWINMISKTEIQNEEVVSVIKTQEVSINAQEAWVKIEELLIAGTSKKELIEQTKKSKKFSEEEKAWIIQKLELA